MLQGTLRYVCRPPLFNVKICRLRVAFFHRESLANYQVCLSSNYIEPLPLFLTHRLAIEIAPLLWLHRFSDGHLHRRNRVCCLEERVVVCCVWLVLGVPEASNSVLSLLPNCEKVGKGHAMLTLVECRNWHFERHFVLVEITIL